MTVYHSQRTLLQKETFTRVFCILPIQATLVCTVFFQLLNTIAKYKKSFFGIIIQGFASVNFTKHTYN